MIYCQQGHENLENAIFCKDCGEKLKMTIGICSNCGAENFKQTKFCGECGKSLSMILENELSTKQIRFYWIGRGGPFSTKMKVFANNEMIGYGTFNKGFNFTYKFELSDINNYLIEIKCWPDSSYFRQFIDISKLEKNIIEFKDDISLFKDRLKLT